MRAAIHKSPMVTIVQRVLPHYRVAFFDRLRFELESRGIDLNVVYGQEQPGTVPATVDYQRDWSTRIENSYFKVGGGRVVWQPCLRRLADSDLVIVEQANSLLLNYWLLAARRVTGRRLAYWGHGRNFQEKGEGGLRSFLKSVLITQADWWFAYTELSAMIVRASGFPEERISTVNNSIDNEDFRKALEAISPDKVRRLKEELGIDGNRVGIYCGGLYTDKRIDFLLESCNKVRNRLNDFHLIIIGSGPEQEKVARAAEECPWIHYVGARFGNDRAPYFKASEILLMPGLVGLAIIDAFTAGTPIFTTDIPIHSPEIAYLSAGLNGFMTAYDTDAYAESVTSYFELHDQREPIRQACLASAKTFGFDQFVGNFSDGIARCLLGST